jgi:hypothetical protein
MPVVLLTAHVAAPIVIDDELHLDGLLETAHPNSRQVPVSRTTRLEDLPTVPIPICSHSLDGLTTRLCTSMRLPDAARMVRSHVVKRRDGEDIEALANGVNLGLGPGKNRMNALTTLITPYVQWLAIGDRRELLRLARRVLFVGSWRSAGYGLVTGWTAENVDADPPTVLVADGVAQRHLPASWCAWHEGTVTGPIRPPYWHPARQTETIVRAGTRCALKPTVEAACHAVADPAALRAHRERKIARAGPRSAGAYPPHVDAGGPRAAGHP